MNSYKAHLYNIENMKGWKLVIDFETIQTKLRKLALEIKSKQYDKELIICCILKGAAYFGVDLSRELQTINIEHSMYFVEASSYKGQEQVELQLLSRLIPEKFQNKHVLLVDELYDNGKTMDIIRGHLVESVPSLTESDITTCVMFQKRKKTDYPDPDLVGMEVPNVWLVGYGLDDNGLKRGLWSVWAVPKPSGSVWTSDDWRIFVNKEISQ